MAKKRVRVAMVGTFDVANFGDLLFPILAEHELRARLGTLDLRRYSYRSMSATDWPYEVRPLSGLSHDLASADLLLVGGGDLVRFDREVAPGYAPVEADVHHPTGYWLTPALLALASGVPVAWNAVGVIGPIPRWAERLVEHAMRASSYVSVRDASSREEVCRVCGSEADVRLVVDTAFGVRNILPEHPGPEFEQLLAHAGIAEPYVLVQPARALAPFGADINRAVEAVAEDGYTIVELPIGPVHGDGPAAFRLDGARRLEPWPDPLLLAEIISRADAVIADSLHLSIVALACGVPVHRPAPARLPKHAGLEDFQGVHVWREDASAEEELRRALGRGVPTADVTERVAQLAAHWDAVAALAHDPRLPDPAFTQALIARATTALEQEAAGAEEASAEVEALKAQLQQTDQELELARVNLRRTGEELEEARREAQQREEENALLEGEKAAVEAQKIALEAALTQIAQERDEQAALAATVMGSTSWRLTAPLRGVGRLARRRPGGVGPVPPAPVQPSSPEGAAPNLSLASRGSTIWRIARTGKALEQRLVVPGARSIRVIGEKIAPLRLAMSESAPERVNLLIPTIDLRYFFGGYITKLALARRLAEEGFRVRLVLVDYTDYEPEAWRRRLADFDGLGSLFDTIDVVYAFDRSTPLDVSPHDSFVATTWWTAHIAHRAVRDCGRDRFVYLIQEYEPFTFPMGSFAALAAQSYSFPHYAVFSTELLRDYFRDHQIGVYVDGPRSGDRASIAFRNAVTDVEPVDETSLANRDVRRLLFYARPEEHAARNMFELGVIALSRALDKGVFDESWEFDGIGTVRTSPRSVPLSTRRALHLAPRADLAAYRRILREHDLGLSLMYTPHPSLVPIEMASAAMVVVTNTFANKTGEALGKISPNLLAVEPTIDDVVKGLQQAVRRTGDFAARVRGASVNWPTSWADSFDEATIGGVARFVNASMREPSTSPK